MNPFYILAPSVTGGTPAKALHTLCHLLNSMGEKAYLIPHPADLTNDARWPYFARFAADDFTDPQLDTPLLSAETLRHHYARRTTPIMLVPDNFETTLEGPFVVRLALDGSTPVSSSQHVLAATSTDLEPLLQQLVKVIAPKAATIAYSEPMKLSKLLSVFVDFDMGVEMVSQLEVEPQFSPLRRFVRSLADWTLPPNVRHALGMANRKIVRWLRGNR